MRQIYTTSLVQLYLFIYLY